MNDYQNFSSLPADQERSFAVYEERMFEAQKKSWTIAFIAAGAFFLIAVGLYLGVTPENKDMTKGMNMSNLSRGAK